MEPWYMNAPRKRRRRRGKPRGHKRGCRCFACKRTRRRVRRGVRRIVRRRRHRRNPAYATIAGGNPPMARKHRRRKGHRRAHRRRHYRRNPGGRGLMSQVKQAAAPVGWGVVGFVGTAAIPNIAARFVPIPDKATSPMVHYAVRAGAAVGTGWLVGMFAGKGAGQAALVGGGIAIVADLVMPFLAGPLGLSSYLDDTGETISAYLDDQGAIGYLNPGMEVNEGIAGSELPDRLNPDNRF